MKSQLTSRSFLMVIPILMLLLAGCASAPTLPPGFVAEQSIKPFEPTPPEVMQAFEAGLNREYLLGPGDVVEIVTPVYPEIAGEQTISPDGQMTVFPVGAVQAGGLTRSEAEKKLIEALTRFYSPLSLTLRVKSYENNQVLVLGKVATPGSIKFRSRPNLLEALSRSGALAGGSQERRMSRCDIIRGKDQLLRVSLDELLKGGTNGRNIELANNDIVYIPENEENNFYIMGEVGKPGAYEIRTSMSILNAIMLAGGPTETAKTGEIILVRDQGKGGEPIKISLNQMFDSANFAGNVLLAKNDIIYVSRHTLGSINYYLRMINPFTQMVLFGTTFTK